MRSPFLNLILLWH